LGIALDFDPAAPSHPDRRERLNIDRRSRRPSECVLAKTVPDAGRRAQGIVTPLPNIG
jgi:hypothetical protein